MIYPNTVPSGLVGGGNDNKRRLQQLLSRNGAMPLFGGSGRSASSSDLPAVGAPPLSFNPFLQMLQHHPGETYNNLPPGLQNLPPGNDPGNAPQQTQGINPFDNGGGGSLGHYNDTNSPGGGAPPIGMNSPTPPPQAQPGNVHNPGAQLNFGIQQGNPMYQQLLQLAMYGQAR